MNGDRLGDPGDLLTDQLNLKNIYIELFNTRRRFKKVGQNFKFHPISRFNHMCFCFQKKRVQKYWFYQNSNN